jgi:hypothetical protein
MHSGNELIPALQYLITAVMDGEEVYEARLGLVMFLLQHYWT